MTDAPVFTVSSVMSEFLGSAPTLQEIIAFKLPDALRALDLLRRRRHDTLNVTEQAELDEFTRMGHFMNRVKLQARLKIGRPMGRPTKPHLAIRLIYWAALPFPL